LFNLLLSLCLPLLFNYVPTGHALPSIAELRASGSRERASATQVHVVSSRIEPSKSGGMKAKLTPWESNQHTNVNAP
jgi:hypothetical protein